MSRDAVSPYPKQARRRNEWIVSERPARNQVDPQRPNGLMIEDERSESGEIVSVVTIFLTNRECPWRCLMCDLWKNTLTETVPRGAIPAQIDYALRHWGADAGLKAARQIKLYNSGSFFDRRAIPPQDYPAIAQAIARFQRVVVECHPALVGDACLCFRDLLPGKLEVAMGLETVHPKVLPKLNKRMTLEQFARAARFLHQHKVALRVFVLVKPPFLNEAEALEWSKRSIDFAFDCDATVVSLIPTRLGNGALEALAANGEFSPPKLGTLEEAASYGIGLRRGRVFADWWDLETFSDCRNCFTARKERLRRMNDTQTVEPNIGCCCTCA
jgi:radical SAM enzyme (TIGR01210 family)